MEDLQTAHMTLPPDYMTKKHVEVKRILAEYKSQMHTEYEGIKRKNQFLFDAYNFDETGEARVLLSNLSHKDKELLNEITTRHPSVPFFKIKSDVVYNRQQVYYSVNKKEERLYQAMKTFVYLDTNLLFLQELSKDDFLDCSFVVASILDDIRYKLLLLYEDVLSHKTPINTARLSVIVEESIWIYYSYLMGRPQITIAYSQLLKFVYEAREFIAIEYLNNYDFSAEKLRSYKEGDNPVDNLLFIDKLKNNAPLEDINFIIGIRFGGIELPYLVKRFIYPNAKVRLVRVSNYSDANVNELVGINTSEFRGKNILIVDDGITTGRTVDKIVQFVKSHCHNVFFACVYFSGPKRFKHMQREGHGGFNIEQLKKCCVLKETNYTASANKFSYTNLKGKFDKTKAKVEAKADMSPTLFDIEIPVERSQQKASITKKVFMACSKTYIKENYDKLMHIRNSIEKNPTFEIIDDWLIERVHNHEYVEKEGRNVLKEAVGDINKSDLVILFYPYPSTFITLLFLAAVNMKKEIWIYYSHKEDLKGFEFYSNKKVFPIKQLKNSFALL